MYLDLASYAFELDQTMTCCGNHSNSCCVQVLCVGTRTSCSHSPSLCVADVAIGVVVVGLEVVLLRRCCHCCRSATLLHQSHPAGAVAQAHADTKCRSKCGSLISMSCILNRFPPH